MFRSKRQVDEWWPLFKKVVFRRDGEIPWLIPQVFLQNEPTSVVPTALCFQGQENPFCWTLDLSLKHFLLFYLNNTDPQNPLIVPRLWGEAKTPILPAAYCTIFTILVNQIHI